MSTLITLSNINPNKGLYSQTSNSIIIDSTTPSGSLFGSGVGTLTVPANGFVVGDSFSLKMGGHLSCANNEDLQIKIITNLGIPMGLNYLADTGIVNMPQCTNQHWLLNITFTIRQLGGAGTAEIVSAGSFSYIKDFSDAFEGVDFSLVQNTFFDTTSSNTLDVQGQWHTLNPANSIYSELGVINKVY